MDHHVLNEDGPLIIEAFDDAGLDSNLLRGIFSYGYEKPAQVQKKALLTMLHSSRSVEVISAAGTGKTALSIMCAIHKIDFSQNLQVLSIVPCREIAYANAATIAKDTQFKFTNFHKAFKALGAHLNLRCDVRCSNMMTQQPPVENPHVIVATPAFLAKEWLQKCHFADLELPPFVFRGPRTVQNTVQVKVLILDEAMDFESRDQVQDVLRCVSLVAATPQIFVLASSRVPNLIDRLPSPMHLICVASNDRSLISVRMYNIVCEKDEWKLDVLQDLIDLMPIARRAVIFCREKPQARVVYERLTSLSLNAGLMTADTPAAELSSLIGQYTTRALRFLVSTPVSLPRLSRCDQFAIEMVINYDLPQTPSAFFEQAALLGSCRFRAFNCITFVTNSDEVALLRSYESYFCVSIPELPADTDSL